jgi:hypothetical protein
MGGETEARALRHAGCVGAKMNAVVENRDTRAINADRFNDDGFQIFPEILSELECDVLAAELTGLFERQKSASAKKVGGVRNLLRVSPRVAELAASERITCMVESLTGQPAFPVRAIFFDKNAGANWSIPWHQDMAITVAERIDAPGFGPWSVKEGIVHVQPPCEILAKMVTMRLHLDDCFAENGALKVVSGSHLQGELSTEAINDWVENTASVTCEIPKGGGLVMRPLLLHASTRVTNPTHRRVLHVEYATSELPNGLRWFER